MRSTVVVLLVGLALALVLTVGATVPVGAQDTPSTGLPTQDIIPRPDTGDPPQSPGDRGGALQLLLPVVIVVAVGGGAWHLIRQARAARTETLTPHPSRSASQASTPSTKPER